MSAETIHNLATGFMALTCCLAIATAIYMAIITPTSGDDDA